MLTSSKHHAGCVVRVAKDGTIPPGNLPGYIKPRACWAYGLRNPFTSFWDVQTNRFFIAEVGGNDNCDSWEVRCPHESLISQGECWRSS